MLLGRLGVCIAELWRQSESAGIGFGDIQEEEIKTKRQKKVK